MKPTKRCQSCRKQIPCDVGCYCSDACRVAYNGKCHRRWLQRAAKDNARDKPAGDRQAYLIVQAQRVQERQEKIARMFGLTG